MSQVNDILFLKHALELAKIRKGFCSPNPSVGAILVSKDNTIVSTGYHMGPGERHAEIIALSNNTSSFADTTLYVTLEPCCHWGKTPPCTDLIIKAGIKKVIYAFCDPNPQVAGKGEARLQTAGVTCKQISVNEIDEFYKSYQFWQKNKRPFVTGKIALSMNGMIAGKQGERILMTGEMLHEYTHSSRKTADAILTTINTILQDNPELNARCHGEKISKPIYILDSNLRTPKTAKIFNFAKSVTIFHDIYVSQEKKDMWLNQNIRCIGVDKMDYGLNLNQVIEQIGEDGIHDLWVEAGGKCFAALFQRKLLQRALIYIAPVWIKEGQTAFPDGLTIDLSSDKIQWQVFGKDVLCDIHW